MRTSNLAKQASIYSTAKIFEFIIKFITPIMLVRIFTKEDYGLYQQLNTLSLTFPIFISLGIHTSFYFFYPNLSKNNRKSLFSQSFYTLFFIGIIFIILFNIFDNYIFSLFGKNSQSLIHFKFPISLFVFFFVLGELTEHLLIVEKKNKFIFSYIILLSILRTLLVLLTAYFTKKVFYTFWAIVIFQFSRSLFIYIYLKIKYQISILKIKFELYKKQMRYSLPVGGATLVETITRKASSLILISFLNPINYAIYSIGTFRIPFINIFYLSITQVSIPKLSEFYFNGEIKKAINLWHKIIIKLHTFIFPIIIFSYVIAKPLFIFLFTEQYIGSIIIFRIIIFSFLLNSIITVPILRAFNKTNLFFKINLISSPFMIAITYILINLFSYVGGAISILVNTVTLQIIFIIKVKKIFNLSINDLLPYHKLINISLKAIIPIFPIFFICKLPLNNNFIILCISTILYFIPLSIIYFKTNILSIDIIKSVFKFSRKQ